MFKVDGNCLKIVKNFFSGITKKNNRKKKNIDENKSNIDILEYTHLAPTDNATNCEEYFSALEWAFGENKINNIALGGPYGSGKSSIVETFLKNHHEVDEKTIKISMATFVENLDEKNANSQKVDEQQTDDQKLSGRIGKITFTTNEIEESILKQLFYKVEAHKIPQSRFRKLHKANKTKIFLFLLNLTFFISIFCYAIFHNSFLNVINNILQAGNRIGFTSLWSLISFSIFTALLLVLLTNIYVYISTKFPLNLKVKHSASDVEVDIEKSGVDSSIFNKNLDEIIYFFEVTDYSIVIFEDMDRLETPSIFVHLRELNILLNNSDSIKKPIKFVYAVKDDIFTNSDRVKFFDFIIPVIPTINPTNSGEILLKKYFPKDEKEQAVSDDMAHSITKPFINDVSPYIEDMRMLQNISNEFILYKKTLKNEQGLTNLKDNNMFALIVFKNLYPYEFSQIQNEKGIIKQAFEEKMQYVNSVTQDLKTKVEELSKVLSEIDVETLLNIKELKLVLLSEVTNWEGIATRIGGVEIDEFLKDDSYLNELSQSPSIRYSYYKYQPWSGNHSSSCNNFGEIFKKFLARKKHVELIAQDKIEKTKIEKESLEKQIFTISNFKLSELIEKYSSEKMLNEEVKSNKLLVFLLRRGYIDENYANYINYFKGTSITKNDMEFVLSVKNMNTLPSKYELTKPDIIVKQLQTHEFEQKEIYNYYLLKHLLSNDENIDKRDVFIKQLTDDDPRSWEIIDICTDEKRNRSLFVKLLANAWPSMWHAITKNATMTHKRKLFYLQVLLEDADVSALEQMNIDNTLTNFINENAEVLNRIKDVEDSKIKEILNVLNVKFNKLNDTVISAVSGELLNYIFDNNHYQINAGMIELITSLKNKELVADLATKNYTTIFNLGYAPLIEYVEDDIENNIEQYANDLILRDSNTNESEESIIRLFEICFDNSELFVKIIKHQNFITQDILSFHNEDIQNGQEYYNVVWSALLENKKVAVTWENVVRYWELSKFSNELLSFMQSNEDELLQANKEALTDEFETDFVLTDFDDDLFESFASIISVIVFDIKQENKKIITENRLRILINCNQFEFCKEYYDKIKYVYPDLCVNYILKNQEKYLLSRAEIDMNSKLLEALLIRSEMKSITIKTLLEDFGEKHMTKEIAGYINELSVPINLKTFESVWGFLTSKEKYKLMIDNLYILDKNVIETLFEDLEEPYNDFHFIENSVDIAIDNTADNIKLANYLQQIGYITKFDINEKNNTIVCKNSQAITL